MVDSCNDGGVCAVKNVTSALDFCEDMYLHEYVNTPRLAIALERQSARPRRRDARCWKRLQLLTNLRPCSYVALGCHAVAWYFWEGCGRDSDLRRPVRLWVKLSSVWCECADALLSSGALLKFCPSTCTCCLHGGACLVGRPVKPFFPPGEGIGLHVRALGGYHE